MVSERRLLKWAVLKEWRAREVPVTLASQSLTYQCRLES